MKFLFNLKSKHSEVKKRHLQTAVCGVPGTAVLVAAGASPAGHVGGRGRVASGRSRPLRLGSVLRAHTAQSTATTHTPSRKNCGTLAWVKFDPMWSLGRCHCPFTWGKQLALLPSLLTPCALNAVFQMQHQAPRTSPVLLTHGRSELPDSHPRRPQEGPRGAHDSAADATTFPSLKKHHLLNSGNETVLTYILHLELFEVKSCSN